MDTIFDPKLLLSRKLRALGQNVPGADFLMRRMAEDLSDRLSAVERHFDKAAILFSLTETAAETVRDSGKATTIFRVETDAKLLGNDFKGLLAGPEHVPLEPGSVDLAVSLLTLHEINDLPGLLFQIRMALRPDGLFLGAMAGGGTLQELRQSLLQAEMELTGGASPRVNPFADVRDSGSLLQRAGFALPVTDVETVTVRYDSMFELMRDLRAMGAGNALTERSRKPATRQLFMRAAEIYQNRFSDPDGRIRATFNMIWMSGWAPHESQQKPLKPGSATVSLAHVLPNKEKTKGGN